jgi:periplasmic protein TonB
MARRFRRYPRVALDNNWEGRSVVRLAIGADGAIASIGVSTSAGHRVLDRQAVEIIRKATGAVEVPAALQGRRFALEIPVIFDLKDQGAR